MTKRLRLIFVLLALSSLLQAQDLTQTVGGIVIDETSEITLPGVTVRLLNTCARIQEQCNPLNTELLVSGALLHQLKVQGEFVGAKIQALQLRGKERLTSLYSIVEYA